MVPLRLLGSLDCEAVRKLLSDHLDGELRGRRRRLVERHVGRCPECGPVFRTLLRAVEGLRALGPPPSGGADVVGTVLSRIRGGAAPAPSPSREHGFRAVAEPGVEEDTDEPEPGPAPR